MSKSTGQYNSGRKCKKKLFFNWLVDDDDDDQKRADYTNTEGTSNTTPTSSIPSLSPTQSMSSSSSSSSPSSPGTIEIRRDQEQAVVPALSCFDNTSYTYKCSRCSKSYSRKNGLAKHYVYYHNWTQRDALTDAGAAAELLADYKPRCSETNIPDDLTRTVGASQPSALSLNSHQKIYSPVPFPWLSHQPDGRLTAKANSSHNSASPPSIDSISSDWNTMDNSYRCIHYNYFGYRYSLLCQRFHPHSSSTIRRLPASADWIRTGEKFAAASNLGDDHFCSYRMLDSSSDASCIAKFFKPRASFYAENEKYAVNQNLRTHNFETTHQRQLSDLYRLRNISNKFHNHFRQSSQNNFPTFVTGNISSGNISDNKLRNRFSTVGLKSNKTELLPNESRKALDNWRNSFNTSSTRNTRNSIVTTSKTTTGDSNSTVAKNSDNAVNATRIPNPCRCHYCHKTFGRPWLLQGHLRTHTGEKPFQCPLCGRAFADRSNLRAHAQTHSIVKKYKCQLCSRTFSRLSLLSKHKMTCGGGGDDGCGSGSCCGNGGCACRL